MTDASSLDAIKIRLMPPWLAQLRRKFFLEMETTIDSTHEEGTSSEYQIIENQT